MSQSPQHILTSFDSALAKMLDDLHAMASLAQRSIANSRRCLVDGDLDAAKASIADDDDIDQFEIDVTRDGTVLLMRFQPLASDLRQVVSAMRLCGDIERVADQAVNVARKSRKLDRGRVALYRDQFAAMYDLAGTLFADSLRAHMDADQVLARGIRDRDRAIDALNSEITERATAEIARDAQSVRDHLAVILIARHIERIGDHAKNIAENAIYAASDTDVRHQKNVLPSA